MSSTTQLTAAQLAHWDDSKQTALYVTMGVFLVLGNLVFVARLYCQSNRVKGLLIEDVALLVALVCLVRSQETISRRSRAWQL